MLTLVPARGGSKRIPRKNVKTLGGFPLILWTLFPFRHLNPVVSSEDDEILSVAGQYGFKTLKRPDALATDTATSVDVALHAMSKTNALSVLLLQPTTPFRNAQTVTTALKLHESSGKAVVAIKPIPHAYIGSQPFTCSLQAPTGSCYVISRGDLESTKTFLPPGFLPVKDTSLGSLDVDHPDEWDHAEAVASSLSEEMKKRYISQLGIDI